MRTRARRNKYVPNLTRRAQWLKTTTDGRGRPVYPPRKPNWHRVLHGSKGVARPAGQQVWQGTCSAVH